MKSVRIFRFLAAVLPVICFGHSVLAEDDADDLKRLQGTWKAIEHDYRGKRTVAKREKVWIFSGNRLCTRLAGFSPSAFEFEIDSKSNPKKLDMQIRARNLPARGEPERACYRFVGDNLEVVTNQNMQKRPASFDSSVNNGENAVSIFRRISNDTRLPDEVLREFEDDPPLHATNRDAEAVLLKLSIALSTGQPLEVIEPLVSGGKARELLEARGPIPAPAPAPELEAALGRLCTRDVAVGERLYYNDGTPFVVAKQDLGPEKALLMLLEGRTELEFFWLYRDDKQWKVDVTNLIERMRNPGPRVFAGIRLGMAAARVRELVEVYRQASKFESFQKVRETDTALIYRWKEGDRTARHYFRFADGELSKYKRFDEP